MSGDDESQILIANLSTKMNEMKLTQAKEKVNKKNNKSVKFACTNRTWLDSAYLSVDMISPVDRK